MMLSTHLLAGGMLGLLFSHFSGGPFPLVLIGMSASLLSDLDIFLEHRKTLHRPFQYAVLSVILSIIFLSAGYFPALAASLVAGSVSLHSFMEIFSEDRSLDSEGRKAVFNHLRSEWIKPLEWVKVGSIRDLGLSLVFAVPVFLTGNSFHRITVTIILIYGLFHFACDRWVRKELLLLDNRFH